MKCKSKQLETGVYVEKMKSPVVHKTDIFPLATL